MADDQTPFGSAVDVNQDGPATITFDNLSYTVSVPVKERSTFEKLRNLSLSGIPKDEVYEKALLTNITGTIKPNTMTALMGPSGAGKSTLLDVLARRKTAGTIEGEMLINGVEPGIAYKRIVGYVEQRDILIPSLTPNELFYYSALLRLPSSVSASYINNRVKQVIHELGLETCQDTIIGDENRRGISGGQAKRVNIGIELLTDPRVLFLDEPTTGLDSTTAQEVMIVLRDITNRGRTTVCTIHQPSSDVFKMFDKLMLLVDGNCVYLGEANQAVPYFEKMGFVHPPTMNPAEYLIAVTGGGTGQGEKMVEGPDVNKNYFIEQYMKSGLASARSVSAAGHKQRFEELQSNRKQLVEEPQQFLNGRLWAFYVITRRQWRMRLNDPLYWLGRFFHVAIMIFLSASAFHGQGHDSSSVYNIVSVLLFGAMNFGFSCLSTMPSVFEQRLFFTRERNASCYQVLPYFLATCAQELIVEVGKVVLWTAIVYPVVKLRKSFSAGIVYFLILVITDFVGMGMTQTFTYMAPDVEAAHSMMFPVLLTFFLFSGFYVQKPLIPDYWIWAYYISYLSYSLNASALNQFPKGKMDGFVQCNLGDCKEVANDVVLANWGFGSEGAINDLWGNVGVLFAFWLAWEVIAYFVLLTAKHGSR